MNVSLDLLKTFATVADLGSFTRAAEVLYRSQSAISLQIKRLESLVNGALFVRTSRQVVLTDRGRALLERAHKLLDAAGEFERFVDDPRIESVVRLGAPDDYAQSVLPQALRDFSRTHPTVRIELTQDVGPRLVEALEADRLDLVMVSRHPRLEGGSLLWREPVVWVQAAAAPPLLSQHPLPLALFAEGCIMRERAIAGLGAAGIAWRAVVTGTNAMLIRSAVAAGIAVAPMIASLVDLDLELLPADLLPPIEPLEVMMLTNRLSGGHAGGMLAQHLRSAARSLHDRKPRTIDVAML